MGETDTEGCSVPRPSTRRTLVAVLTIASAALPAMATAPAFAQSAGGNLDSALGSICANAAPGSSLESRCFEIFGAPPPPGDMLPGDIVQPGVIEGRRSALAGGNNLGVSSALGRSTTAVSGEADDVRKRRRDAVTEEENGSAGAFGTDAMFGNLSVLVSGAVGVTQRDQTAFENGWDAESFGVSGGADYRFSNAVLAGLVVGYETIDAEFNGNAGELDTETISVTAFVTVAPRPASYIDAYAGFGDIDYENARGIAYSLGGLPIVGVATSETSGEQFIAGWSAGYQASAGPLTYGPRIAFDFSETSIDPYAETDTLGFALAYGEQTITSAQLSIGGSASHAISTSWGVVIPQVSLDYTHEFEDDARTITSRFVSDAAGTPIPIRTEEPDRDFLNAGIGIVAVLPNGIVPFANYEAMFGHDFLNDQQLTLGVRFEL